MGEAFGVAVAERRNIAIGDRDEVGRGGTHICEERLRMHGGDCGGARVPVGGRNVGDAISNLVLSHEAGTPGIE